MNDWIELDDEWPRWKEMVRVELDGEILSGFIDQAYNWRVYIPAKKDWDSFPLSRFDKWKKVPSNDRYYAALNVYFKIGAPFIDFSVEDYLLDLGYTWEDDRWQEPTLLK